MSGAVWPTNIGKDLFAACASRREFVTAFPQMPFEQCSLIQKTTRSSCLPRAFPQRHNVVSNKAVMNM